MLFDLAADLVLLLHASYVAFVVFGQVAILIGILLRWAWVRNRRFRRLHLAAISIVVAESLLGIICPLTALEAWLRAHGGQTAFHEDFVAHWVHMFLFYDLPPWVFIFAYTAFGLLVLATFVLAPPRGKGN